MLPSSRVVLVGALVHCDTRCGQILDCRADEIVQCPRAGGAGACVACLCGGGASTIQVRLRWWVVGGGWWVVGLRVCGCVGVSVGALGTDGAHTRAVCRVCVRVQPAGALSVTTNPGLPNLLNPRQARCGCFIWSNPTN